MPLTGWTHVHIGVDAYSLELLHRRESECALRTLGPKAPVSSRPSDAFGVTRVNSPPLALL